ncbi:MAG: sulfotransferase [Cyanothece sp. SIO1E1]|nr:sulfotransferase [Cyanothece sp. SIO1E1]
MQKLLRPLRRRLKSQLYELAISRQRFQLSESLLVFGDPRGGTTWFMEVLSHIPNTIMLEEPLHVNDGCFPKALNFGWRQPIPRGTHWKEATNAFARVLSGKEISLSALRPNSLQRLWWGKRLVVKFARGNALLPWLCDQFHFEQLPIYLMRHPLAVAASQIRNFPESAAYRPFEVPDHPHHDLYVQHQAFLQKLSTRLQQLVALWCLHNQQILQQTDVKWLPIHYEYFLLYPHETLSGIEKQWNMSFPKAVFDAVERRSSSDYSGDFRSDEMEQLEKWHLNLSAKESQAIQAILDYFGIHIYRASDPLPVSSKPF